MKISTKKIAFDGGTLHFSGESREKLNTCRAQSKNDQFRSRKSKQTSSTVEA